jgi:hypothetical protein
MAAYLNSEDDFNNDDDDNRNDNKPKAIGHTIDATDEPKEKEEPQLVVREASTEEEGEVALACEYCSEYPCVWESKKKIWNFLMCVRTGTYLRRIVHLTTFAIRKCTGKCFFT